jgi:hypothetical protein
MRVSLTCFHGREVKRVGELMTGMSLWIVKQVLVDQIISSDIQCCTFTQFIMLLTVLVGLNPSLVLIASV